MARSNSASTPRATRSTHWPRRLASLVLAGAMTVPSALGATSAAAAEGHLSGARLATEDGRLIVEVDSRGQRDADRGDRRGRGDGTSRRGDARDDRGRARSVEPRGAPPDRRIYSDPRAFHGDPYDTGIRGDRRDRDCRPRRALRRAWRMGLDDARIDAVRRGALIVSGYRGREYVRVRFARRPSCPVIAVRAF